METWIDSQGRTRIDHPWPTDHAGCVAIQTALRAHVRCSDDFGTVATVGGVDIGFEDNGRITRAAVVLLDVSDLKIVDSVLIRQPTRMPYIPGLLSFREVPAAIAALETLERVPDILLVDGHGYAHPRRLGIATHLGLVSGLPSIGVAKKRLVGRHGMPASRAGAWVELMHEGELIGGVLRTRDRVKPVFVSPGHRLGLGSAIAWTLRCCSGYRLPEATRQADKLASRR